MLGHLPMKIWTLITFAHAIHLHKMYVGNSHQLLTKSILELKTQFNTNVYAQRLKWWL